MLCEACCIDYVVAGKPIPVLQVIQGESEPHLPPPTPLPFVYYMYLFTVIALLQTMHGFI